MRFEALPPVKDPESLDQLPKSHPIEESIEVREGDPVYSPHSIVRRAQRYGSISFDNLHIYLGQRWAGGLMRVVDVGELIHVFYGDQLVRAHLPDRSKSYQPGASKPGRKVRPWD